ncbi:hypothetical protein [Planctomyces sp. SH-PL62]|nr:hypothetical protein [Planctomyces sp. SH-PL62]
MASDKNLERRFSLRTPTMHEQIEESIVGEAADRPHAEQHSRVVDRR